MKNWKDASKDEVFWHWDKTKLTQNDWDFHWIENETSERKETILLYEYAREQNQFREFGLIPQEAFKDLSAWEDYPLLCEWPFGHEVLIHFPETPARGLSSNLLKEMEASISNRSLPVFDLSTLIAMQEMGIAEKTNASTLKRSDTSEIVSFEIDWALGPKKLTKHFGNWLKKESERAQVYKRVSHDNLLKSLGIYRLLQAYGKFEDASAHAYASGNDYLYKYLFNEQSEWSKAKVRALETLVRLYPPRLFGG